MLRPRSGGGATTAEDDRGGHTGHRRDRSGGATCDRDHTTPQQLALVAVDQIGDTALGVDEHVADRLEAARQAGADLVLTKGGFTGRLETMMAAAARGELRREG